jgi:hypothetical protein
MSAGATAQRQHFRLSVSRQRNQGDAPSVISFGGTYLRHSIQGLPGNLPACRSGLLAAAPKATITRFASITSQDSPAWSRRRRRSRCAAAEGGIMHT